jgi:RND family efflux transporter MFP subunit
MTHASLIAVMLAVAACSSKSGGDAPGKSGKGRGGGGRKLEYPVDVAKLEQRQVTYAVTAPGTIEAFQEVQITARVAGAVDKVTFVEGQAVKAGAVLAVIESERYQIAVAQAKAAVAKAQATQRTAEASLQRRLNAQKDSPGLVPGEEIEQKQTAVDTAKADVDAAQQAMRVAALNLRESFVRAPIAGIVQTRTVQQGQYLQPGAVLATILQRDPLLLRFQVTESDAPRLEPGMTATIALKNSQRTYAAKLTLVAGAAEPSTRMVPVTAEIEPTEHDYWLRPGAFCVVTIPIGDARPGIVVPSLAVTPTEEGNVVYVVDDKGFAHAHVVTLGMRTPDGGVELRSGVQPGDLMVVRGVEPLSDGAPVAIKSTTTLEAALHAGSAAATGSGSGSP